MSRAEYTQILSQTSGNKATMRKDDKIIINDIFPYGQYLQATQFVLNYRDKMHYIDLKYTNL